MSSSTNIAARRAHFQTALTAFADAPPPKGLANLLNRAVSAIAAQFERKNTGNLFSGRGGKLTDVSKQVKHTSDFELITWLVIKDKNDA